MLTRNGWAVAVLTLLCLATGLWLDYVELAAIGMGLLACFALATVWLLVRPSLQVEREILPPRVAEQEGAVGVITITNTSSRRSPSLLAEEHVGDRTVAVSLRALPAGGSHRTSYPLPTGRRGVLPIGPLAVSHADPLGLVGIGYGRGGRTHLIVHPRTVRVAPLPTGRSQELDGPTRAGAPRGGIAFHSLREYSPGDDLRLVHWPSTARTGTLMVRHNVITSEPRLAIVLDTSVDSYVDEEAFETAVRVAASLLLAGVNQRYPTSVRTTGGADAGTDALGQGVVDAMDLLASVEPLTDDPGLHSLLRSSAREERGVSLGVVTGQPEHRQLGVVSAVRTRYEMTTLIQVGERFGRPGAALPGVLSVACDDLEGFRAIWKAKVG